MRLKEIKLAGFKSFVDPTTVRFPGNRNAVVGPNGCGKSNVIDAVRWVMGESSARQLRGEAMTDVIFSGSKTRAPTSLASIELVFDNRDGRIGGEYASYAEISVRRVVSRVAQSSYYLNGTRCRRRDIADVFLGTGFGPRSYSIIEQGMISQLVEAKPEELRAYLEEAAGISKYRERRRETQNRIRHTLENLERLADLREELARQIKHLKRQARDAERFRELKEQHRRCTAELCALRLEATSATLAQLEERTGDLQARFDQAVAARQRAEDALEQARARQSERTKLLDSAQGDYYQCSTDVSKLNQSIEFERRNGIRASGQLAALAAQSAEAERDFARDAERIDALEEQIGTQAPQLEAAAARDAAAAERMRAIEDQSHAVSRAWDEFNQRLSANDREKHVADDRIRYGERTLGSLRGRLGKLDAEPAAPDAADAEPLRQRADEAQRQLAARSEAVQANRQAIAALRDEAQQRERAVAAARAEEQRQRRDHAALAAVQDAALGRGPNADDAAAEWLAQHGLQDAARLGEELSVEPGWERAAEAALGDAVRGIAVADDAQLAESIDGLANGRVTLLAAAGADTADHCADAPDAPLEPLARHVRGPLGALLGGVYAAASLAEALAHRKRLGAAESIVTPSGLRIGPDWMRIERSDGADDGVLRRHRELDALERRASEADARLAAAEAQLSAVRERQSALAEERDGLQARHAEAASTLSRAKADYDIARVRLEAATAREQRNAKERADLDAQIDRETQALEAGRARRAQLEETAQALAAEGLAQRGERERMQRETNAARTAAREAKEAHHRCRIDHQDLIAKRDAAAASRKRLTSQRRDFADRRAALESELAAAQVKVPKLQESVDAKQAERRAVEERLVELRRALDVVASEIRTLTAKRAESDTQADALRSERENARLERARVLAEHENIGRALEETGIGLEDARDSLAQEQNPDAGVWQERIDAIAGRIERLGAVNLTAIEEHREQAQRKEELDGQHADLEAALETLRTAIRRIDRDTRALFQQTFEQVNAHLDVLFPKVFGGGRAYLEMTGEDWLDAGVAFMARPPGKRNASIHLLSGGEKAMAAVALVFSLFRLNPSPVCLLDEVDAPLDDANVTRFADLIREMSDDVQFVVVTHNKQTMEMADHLLGVTMQEPGVSRLVSVDVDRAARLAAAG